MGRAVLEAVLPFFPFLTLLSVPEMSKDALRSAVNDEVTSFLLPI
jgi:hypothetical protein